MHTNVLLYYFTGTGNSHRAAQWMASTARQAGLTAQVTPINAANPASEIKAGALLGLLYPAHGFTAPWAILRFALALPPGRGVQAFTAMPRGALKLGRLHLPGMEGSGNYLVGLILWLKGYQLRGAIGLDMPGSWTALLPGLPPEAVTAMLARMQPRVQSFMADLLAGRTRFECIIEGLLGLLLLPVSFMYLIMGRFFLAKMFYASARCNGCGLCAQNCPVRGVVMKRDRPYWTFLCESCTRCMNYCPQQAVEASYPFGALIAYLASLPASAFVLDALARAGLHAAGWQSPVLAWIIDYPYKLLALALGYGILALLLRVRWFNTLLTTLTPTHYYRRYHEPGTRLKDIAGKQK